jgi:orotidine-5'-phosphate decarboxylase
LGRTICILKTHIDIISDFGPHTTAGLTALAKKHNFLVFEDRKFADIGSTVRYQYRSGCFHIVDWAHIVNAHIISGEGIVDGLEEVAHGHESSTGRGLLLLAEMSSEGTLTGTVEFTQKGLEMARKRKSFVMGFVANGALAGQNWSEGEDFLIFTTDVNSSRRDNVLGQCYQRPREAVSRGSDIVIVGRSIFGAQDPAESARVYQKEGWEAHEKRVTFVASRS